jgi:hypothetical protein
METNKIVNVDYSTVQKIVKHLLGKTLTLVESSITNEKQLEAMKSIIKNNFGETLSDLYREAIGEEEYAKVLKYANETYGGVPLKEVDITEL